jgi:Zn-dependent protease
MNFDLFWLLKTIPAVIIGLTIHELAHAYTAYKLGDMTSKNDGRLTFNPLKHIDPLGFIFIVIAGFGWAKPVSFNPNNLKKPHRDEILISLAGPFSNFLLALLFLVAARLLYIFPYFHSTPAGLAMINLFILWAVINFGLFFFNMLPLPPLDGSHLYTTYLKELNPKLLNKIYTLGTYGLLLILLIQHNTGIEILPLAPLIKSVTTLCISFLQFH